MKKLLLLVLILMLGYFSVFKRTFSTSIRLPVDFSYDLLKPLIKIEVEKKRYDILVDLGSNSSDFTLVRDVLDEIEQKENLEDFEMYDLKGNSYICHMYRVPKIEIKNIPFFNANVAERNDDYVSNVRVWPLSNNVRSEERIRGKIGLPIFQNYLCFFNFPDSEIVLEKNSEEFKKNFPVEEYICIPFSLEPYGVVIHVQTDVGVLKVILDTGATYSVVHNSIAKTDKVIEIEEGSKKRYYSTDKLIIGGCNFGIWDFAFFDIGREFEVDGCLGADFFLEHAVALDFQSKKAYLKKPERFEIFTQWKRLKTRVKQLYQKMFSYVDRSIDNFFSKNSEIVICVKRKEAQTVHLEDMAVKYKTETKLAQGEDVTEVTVEITWDFFSRGGSEFS